MEINRPFIEKHEQTPSGIGIPAELLYNFKLTQTEKILFGYIRNLSRSSKGCYASNNYLGKIVGVGTQSISNSIQNLKKYLYINVEFIKRKTTNEQDRKITINPDLYNLYDPLVKAYYDNFDKLDSASLLKNLEGHIKKIIEDYKKNCNNKDINKDISLSKDKLKEAKPLDVETDNILTNKNLPNKDFETILPKIEQQVQTLLQKNSDIQKIIDYWNNLPKPLSDHKNKNTKTYLLICQSLEKLLKKNYADKIINSIQTYFDLITFPYFKLSSNIPGVIVSLDNFIKINGYLKTKIKESDLLISWFEKCSTQTLEQLKEKYSKESKDLYPDITNALKAQWHDQIDENKIFSVAEENYLKKAAISAYNYFKNIKDFRFDSYYRREYPATCTKLVIKALLKNHPDIEMVPGWLWSDNFFKNILETYLRKNTYIVDGHDTPRSNGSWQPLSDPEDLEYVRKQNEEKERETRNSCLTEDDFL